MIYDGVKHFPGFIDRGAQESLVSSLRGAVLQAPLFIPLMPRTGRPFSVRA
jgi:alkylated DNA repair protein (DNA oxidative demethylase)